MARHARRATSPSAPETIPLARPPTLVEVLGNYAAPPFTLAAFVAFLSQSHCLETLEFIADAQRYRTAYLQALPEESETLDSSPSNTISTLPRSATPTPGSEATQAAAHHCTSWRQRDVASVATDGICTLWQELMRMYVARNAPSEVNLPSATRDELLGLPAYPTPPSPSTLDQAVLMVYELMEDSIMSLFLQSSAVLAQTSEGDQEGVWSGPDVRHHVPTGPRDIFASRTCAAASSNHHCHRNGLEYQALSVVPHNIATHNLGHIDFHDNHSSIESSASSHKPKTPPTTPHTISNLTFASSRVQRALNAYSDNWKLVRAGFGLGKDGRPSSTEPTSSASLVWNPAEDDHHGTYERSVG